MLLLGRRRRRRAAQTHRRARRQGGPLDARRQLPQRQVHASHRAAAGEMVVATTSALPQPVGHRRSAVRRRVVGRGHGRTGELAVRPPGVHICLRDGERVAAGERLLRSHHQRVGSEQTRRVHAHHARPHGRHLCARARRRQVARGTTAYASGCGRVAHVCAR